MQRASVASPRPHNQIELEIELELMCPNPFFASSAATHKGALSFIFFYLVASVISSFPASPHVAVLYTSVHKGVHSQLSEGGNGSGCVVRFVWYRERLCWQLKGQQLLSAGPGDRQVTIPVTLESWHRHLVLVN